VAISNICSSAVVQVESSLDEMRVLTQPGGEHSPIHQGLFADPIRSTQHRESWHIHRQNLMLWRLERGWEASPNRRSRMLLLSLFENRETIKFQKGGAARVFLWPAIQAAVSVVSEELLRSVLLCWLNDAIAFSERGADGPRGGLGVWGWVVASSNHCNPPMSRRVLSSGLIDNAAGRRASAFRVVVDCVFILVDEAGKTWV
jgi:hypothetical protein